MLHYSGDVDGSVPTLGTINWIQALNLTVTDEWRPFYYDDQVAGYTESYDTGLTFASVHGAGHMAPQYKPEQTFYLIFNWITNSPF